MKAHPDPSPAPSPSALQLRSHLARARQALVRDALGRGFLALVCFGLLISVLALLASHHWPGASNAIWGVSLVLVLALTLEPWWSRRALLRDPLLLARWIESRRPAYRNDVSASLEFSQRAVPTSEAAALRQQLDARVEGLLARSHSWKDILPRRHPRRERMAWLVAVVFAFGLMMTPRFRAALAPSLSANGLAGSTAERMLVGTVEVHVQPPSYTRLQEQTLLSVTGGFMVPEGSTLTVKGRSFEPAERAWLWTDGSDEPKAIELRDGRFFETEWVLTEEQRFRFGFQIGGKDYLDTTTYHARVFADSAPVVTLHEPAGDLEVTPGQVVELHYDVRDDYGLRDVHLVWHFKGREQDAERILLLDDSSGTFAEDTAPFDTAPLYMQPGDEVIVYVEARDNVSFRTPNIGQSPALSFFVQEEHRPEAELLVLKEQLFEALLTQLGGVLPIPFHTIESDGKDGFRLRPRLDFSEAENASHLRALEEQLQDFPQVLDRLREIVALLDSFDEADPRERGLFATMLGGLSQHERVLVRQVESLSIPLQAGAVSAQQLRGVFEPHAAFIEDLERATLVLEALISEHQAADVARALEELSQIRERLRELLEQYKETRDPDLRARIERELDRLSKRMNELIEELSSQVQNLPQEHFNAEALDQSETAERVASMADAMQALKEQMASGDIDAAMDAFDQLSRSLDELNRELGDPMAGADSDTLSEFDQAMGELMDEINAIEAMQQAIEEETAAMERELREEKLEENRERLERQLAAALKTVREARQRLVQAPNPSEDEALGQATRTSDTKLEALERRLENRDLSVAEDAALDAMDALKQLESEANRTRRFATEDGAEKALRQLETLSGKDADRMRKLAEELSEIQQSLQPQAGDARSEQLESLRERQSSAGERMNELQQKMAEVGEQFPMMNPEGDSSMESVQQGMKESSSQLQQRQPGPARSGQRQALDGLQGMRQAMQQRMAQSRQQMQQQAQREGRGQMKRDKVDVGQEAERNLRQRQQIMDAMREGALEAWDDPIRQYYESLVR